MFTVGKRGRSPRGQSRKTAVRCEGAREGSRGKVRLVPRSEAAVAVRSWSRAGGIHGVGSPNGLWPHLGPERRSVSGWPGPAPPCAAPTRDARHLPAHLPALSSQPPAGALSGCHCSSFFVATPTVGRWGTLSGSHQSSARAIATPGHCPSSQTSQTDAGMAGRELCQCSGGPLESL